MVTNKQEISLSPLNEFVQASNETTLVLTEFLNWVREHQESGGSKVSTKMNKSKLKHIQRNLLLLKKRTPPLQRLFREIARSGIFSRNSGKNVSFGR